MSILDDLDDSLSDEQKIIQLKLAKLDMLERQEEQRRLLPHRHLFKHYRWSQEFYEDVTSRIQVVVAANQISKSSSQIRKCIEMATNKELWPKAWPKKHKVLGKDFVPNLFSYMYPDAKTADSEWRFKWKQFMPGYSADHPVYGWKPVYDARKYISEIRFNSGVTVQFKFYSQDVQNLMAGSIYALFIDEECPWHIIPELMMRTNATSGIINSVFTATLGQEEWRRVVEYKNEEERIWPEARVWQVSMYDCIEYADGSATPWNVEEIKRIEAKCGTEKEVQRRVYGRFVRDEGLMYPSFNSENRCDVKELEQVDESYSLWAAMDYGGGGSSHPSAICIIAVRQDFKKGYVYRFWRGDGILTSAGDVLDKFLEMRGAMYVWKVAYDFAAKDLGTLAERQGLVVEKADKQREGGRALLNTLFKQKMLWLPNGDHGDHMQFDKLAGEFNTLSEETDKKRARDDGIDSTRYCCKMIPWQVDYANVYKAPEEVKRDQDPRRQGFELTERPSDELLDEMSQWQDLLDG
jgi:phage terminase large subunit-like protein